jgi:N-acetylornithine carbamoyltransferase
MSKNLLGWHLLPQEDWDRALIAARDFRMSRRGWSSLASGKSICLMFFNASLRTRTSMEIAAAQLGAHATTVTPGSGVWSMAFEDGAVMDGDEAEHVREAVGVLSRYYDAIGVRLFASMTDLEQDRADRLLARFAEAASVPVVSLESAFWHPCQELADAATIRERLGGETHGKKLVLSWSYHPRALPMAVPNSAVMMAARLGMDVTVARPEGYELDASVMEMARDTASESGGSLTETDDQVEAFEGADVVYAKGWAGGAVYTSADAEAKRRGELKAWRITRDVMSLTRNAAFMHCLPVRRNVVVDDAVLDSANAIHLLQAEYRLHAQKAILEMIWDLGESGDRYD